MASQTQLLVSGSRMIAGNVLELTLADPGGAELASWTPGAHIDIVLPSGAIRSYSLCGDPEARFEYRLAILRDANGRGGSAEAHETKLIGRHLTATGPRNAFPVVESAHYDFIAGGIGITAILPMVKFAARTHATWRMHYLGASRQSMAYLTDVIELGDRKNGSIDIVVRDEGRRLDISGLLSSSLTGAAVYCCGPERLLVEVEGSMALAGRSGQLHVERFGRPLLPGQNAATGATSGPDVETYTGCDPDGPFDVELRRTGVTLHVPAGKPVLGIVRTVRRDLTYSCSSGYCGTCEVKVLAGIPDHRDEVLTDAEKKKNGSMMICVGRSRTTKLVLDL